ncbi:hypothetical protein [Allostreptomyces psammosilenae]|uniref:Uncharacterized protein n=1 Tax=Allostreptomyces psammosilenae TaxID=1892865 RepID=A0A853A8Z1_9ACTN|nr:hypothetical protein [Allostreptomyces psammosilenae]NYI06988.1 hypothetical protein [Allostreptomyces psammosilenae]
MFQRKGRSRPAPDQRRDPAEPGDALLTLIRMASARHADPAAAVHAANDFGTSLLLELVLTAGPGAHQLTCMPCGPQVDGPAVRGWLRVLARQPTAPDWEKRPAEPQPEPGPTPAREPELRPWDAPEEPAENLTVRSEGQAAEYLSAALAAGHLLGECAVVMRSVTNRPHPSLGGTVELVRGWYLTGRRLHPLDQAQIFAAQCTDAMTGEPLPPQPRVEYVTAFPVRLPGAATDSPTD